MAELNAKFSLEQRQIRANFSLEQATIPAIFKINASGTTWGSISGDIQNQEDLYLILQDKASVESVETLAETVQNNYDILDGKIDDTESALAGQITALSDTVNINNQNINNRVDNVILDVSANTNAISTINNTISGYGNIVTHNVNEFATAAQGALAYSALQPGDNISELVNNIGYITSASLPTVNNASLTIQRNGSLVAIFTANDSVNKTANILVPTQASDIGALPDTTTIVDLTTQAQLDAINSGATATNIGQITTNENDIANIRDLIPNQATSSNQLADKAFVNSSIATNTAYFIGTFNSVAELEAYSGPLTNNDYAFVATTDAAGNTLYDRYKYNADTQQWIFEYELNNSSFTAAQWESINSGITSGDVSLIQSALQPNDNVSELVNDAGYITSASLPTVNNGTLNIQVNGTSIGTFTANQANNTTANIVVPDSAMWGNITGTLSNQTDLQNALNAKQDVIDANNKLDYAYLSNTPTIPTVNDATLTIQQNGTTVNTFTANASSNVTANITVPTDTNDLTNGAGYITGITSSDVTTALGYTPLSNSTKYGADLSYSSNTLQLLDQDGNNLGNSVTIQSSPDIDGISITTNADDELQTVGVIDQNNTSTAIKTWTGTKAQYDAIVTKDANTLYNITDDTDVTLTLLEALYPVGSIYIGTMANCPLATLGVGTWQLVAVDRVLQGAGTRGNVGTTVNESLPNITGYIKGGITENSNPQAGGAFNINNAYDSGDRVGTPSWTSKGVDFDASRSSSTYQDNAPVQQDAYLVNIWERTA